MPIVDASVTSSVFIATDTFHEPSVRWWRAAHRGRGTLYGPSILVAEVTAAIRRLTGDSARARIVIRDLTGDRQLTLVDSDLSLCTRAAEIAADVGLKGCDAIYVALAERLGEPLITFDREQLERAAALVTVLRPG